MQTYSMNRELKPYRLLSKQYLDANNEIAERLLLKLVEKIISESRKERSRSQDKRKGKSKLTLHHYIMEYTITYQKKMYGD